MKNRLLNKKFIIDLLIENKLIVIDGGARGEVFPPFNNLSKEILKVIRFEPDPKAKIEENDNELIYPKGLWSESKTLNLNIAHSAAASSVLDFNIPLQKYIDPLINLRKVEKKVEIECISIDEFLQTSDVNNIDFIKLDIHGAEYETLQGANTTLSKTLGLLIESWTIPIHKNQKIRADVEKFVFSKEFFLFEENYHSLWARRNKYHYRRQPVSVDSFYLIDPLIKERKLSKIEAIKLIGIADLFDHVGYALQLNEKFLESDIIDKQLFDKINKVLNQNFKFGFLSKIKFKLLTYFVSKLNNNTFS